MRHRRRLKAELLLALLALAGAPSVVLADYPGLGPGPTVGCGASTAGFDFGGTCVSVDSPTAPTKPSYDHPWLLSTPVAAPACSPHEVTQWATGTSADGWRWNGSFWTLGGQRVPILYSTPLLDTGWSWEVTCGSPGAIRYVGVVQKARTPSPCSPGTPSAACRPGFSGAGFLASVERQVPQETITATPPGTGVVGVSVELAISPIPRTEYATVTLAAPDLGDQDPGELLHVVWVVQARPQGIVWRWPDGTTGGSPSWVPQVAFSGGELEATVSYSVTATGFWSNGVAVRQLAAVEVGTITVSARLPYSVQQVQADLG